MRELICCLLLWGLPMTLSYADSSAAPQGSGMMSQFLLLGGFIVIFYWMMWRPQQKRAKAHRDLLASLVKDDEVVTTGGILGRITHVSDQFVRLSVADGFEICVQKQSIATPLPKGTLTSI